MYRFLFLYILTIPTICSYGQKKFHVDFYAEDCSKKRELSFFFDNGEKIIPAKVTTKDKQYSIEGLYFGKFTFLEIKEKIDSSSHVYKRYLLDETPAKIQYISCDTANTFNYWKNIYVENAKKFTPFLRNSALFANKEFNEFNEEQDKVYNLFKLNKPIQDLVKEKKILEIALNNLSNKQFEFIKLHPEDYMSFIGFRDIINQKLELDSDNVWDVFNTFPNDIKNSFEGEKLFFLITEKRNRYKNAPEVGKTAPDFKATDILGKEIKLTDFKGKHTLLVFWATWCGPCVKEIPIIKSIRNKFTPSELSIVYVSDDTDESKMLSFIKKNNMNWFHIFGNKSIREDYFINALPETLLIDPNGKIIYLNVGNDLGELNKKLSESIR